MVDIETLGCKPNAVIVQIGACFFDRDTGEMGAQFIENVCPQDCIDKGFTVDGDTIKFWLEQEKHDWVKEGQNLRDVLGDFRVFAKSCKYVWAHATFDFPILVYAYNHLCIDLPFHYRAMRDLRTLVDLAGIEYHTAKERKGSHNALADCRYQVKYCVECLNKIKHGKGD